MTGRQRIVEHLNAALSAALADDERLYLLGEDIADPYGGAFKVTRGLSTRFPERVLTTPISENGIVGLAGGLALAGDKAIVEIMFSDFVTLAFDPIVNFAAKSTTMYGRRVPIHLVVRCPTGGNRGYGPTHSQSLQKHFLGVPGLAVYELSPLHDSATVLATMLGAGTPALHFEDKSLYGGWLCRDGVVDDVFRFDLVGDLARVFAVDPDDEVDCVLIAPGGLVPRAVTAMRELLLADEIVCHLLVPSRLYPLDVAPMAPALSRARRVVVVEESTAGGTWGAEVAHAVRDVARGPVTLVHSADSVIPTAPHLERSVLVSPETIRRGVREALS
ncbi:alpha-ketoacid dehydrogenase subunit beta [Luedemannella helvata]|uniref:Pyruvate dehydrogenase E1 component subunit beta n=1 Tax=Luedemannella helvata TaxID=349315 RepID=A0ABP4VW89_9ACTN